MSSLIRLSPLARSTLLAAAALLAPAAAADVIVVDDDGGVGVDFTDIQPAIDAAATGDTIVVRDGDYGSFEIAKGLRLVADTGHAPDLGDNGGIIRDIDAPDLVVVSGLAMEWLYAHDCDSEITVEGCTIGPSSFAPALRAYRCVELVVARSSVRGAAGADDNPGFPVLDPQRGLEALDALVIVSQSSVRGGSGGGAFYKSDGKDGQPGVLARDATLYLQTAELRGGAGGWGWGPDPFEFDGVGGDGAPALSLERCHVEIFGRDTDIVRGGTAGLAFDGPGVDGAGIVADDSTILHGGVSFEATSVPFFDGAGSSLDEVVPGVPVVTAEGSGLMGDAIDAVLRAPANAQYLLWFSPLTGALQVGTKRTALLLEPLTLFELTIGAVGETGTASHPLALPVIPEAQGTPVHFQAYVRLPAGAGDRISTSAGFTLR